jgi:probable phosphoglycerate mutase
VAELWLMRHGATEWSRSGAHTGRTDLPLVRDGEVAARESAAASRKQFALVFVSPLTRARETAIAGYGDVAQVEPDLREWTTAVRRAHPADIRKSARTGLSGATVFRRAKRSNRWPARHSA